LGGGGSELPGGARPMTVRACLARDATRAALGPPGAPGVEAAGGCERVGEAIGSGPGWAATAGEALTGTMGDAKTGACRSGAVGRGAGAASIVEGGAATMGWAGAEKGGSSSSHEGRSRSESRSASSGERAPSWGGCFSLTFLPARDYEYHASEYWAKCATDGPSGSMFRFHTPKSGDRRSGRPLGRW
jgi:hypothetical protein